MYSAAMRAGTARTALDNDNALVDEPMINQFAVPLGDFRETGIEIVIDTIVADSKDL